MKILLSWSSGKDSAWALHLLNRQYPGAVAALLTTVNAAMDLPGGVDPCGERGEFHSCVCAGPMFSEPIADQAVVGADLQVGPLTR